MALFIRCERGLVARGQTDDAVIERVRDHMCKDHPDLLETVSRDGCLGWFERE
jgi:hypothetical protein